MQQAKKCEMAGRESQRWDAACNLTRRRALFIVKASYSGSGG